MLVHKCNFYCNFSWK